MNLLPCEESSIERGDPSEILWRACEHVWARLPWYRDFYLREGGRVAPDMGFTRWPATHREVRDVLTITVFIGKLLKAPDQWRVFDL